MIKEAHVTFEQAKRLKELGFPQNLYFGSYFYDENGKQSPFNGVPLLIPKYACPTLSLVQKWLREEEELYIGIITDTNKEKWKYGRNFKYDIIYCGTDSTANIFSDDIKFDKYEEALSAGIDKCIEILKGNENF